MGKYICSVCGYTHEGNEAPGRCPVCKSASSQFTLQDEFEKDDSQNLEHVINVKNTLGNDEIIQEKGNSQEYNEDTAEDAINIVSSQKDGYCSEDDVNEILKFGNAKLQAVKWYQKPAEQFIQIPDGLDVIRSRPCLMFLIDWIIRSAFQNPVQSVFQCLQSFFVGHASLL